MILWTIDRLGGLASTAELRRAGVDRGEAAAAIEAGLVIRVRQGWYSRSSAPSELVAAARVGGLAGCATALRSFGAWTSERGLHVAVRGNACQLRSPHDSRHRLSASDGVRVHWDARDGTSRLRVDPIDALRDLALCASDESVVASADSLLRLRPDLRHWSRFDLSSRLSAVLASADGVCESGTETYFWLRIGRRLGCRRQVRIPGVGRVDFLIGERLIVEIDGAAYHTDPASFERDRRRDAVLSALGYRVLRFSYRQVMDEWSSVEQAVRAAVARQDHL